MLFALLSIPIVAAVGLAVDVGRAYRIRAITQMSLDSSILAAGRAAQSNSTNPLSAASTAASTYFNITKPTDVVSSTVTFSANNTNTEFTLTATSWVQTPFLGALFGISRTTGEGGAPTACLGNKYSCLKVTATASASIASGGNGGSNVEVSLMLDVTGSMSGSKITTLIDAAKDLVDTVVWTDQSKYTSRVALAPFAPAVNVGEAYYELLTNESLSYSEQVCQGKKKKKNCSTSTNYYAPCVVERMGTHAYTDATPGSGSWLVSWVTATGDDEDTCTPDAPIVPLTSNKTTLKNAIDKFTAGGATAGQLGTAFAWYLISPKWASIWGTASAPGSYEDLTTLNSNGAPKLQKFVVLMTDGEYNTIQGSNGSTSTANSRAATLCTNMKAAGIVVYSVGFQLDSDTSKNMLKNCASSADKYYDASSNDLLISAFRDIALKISTLRLTN